MINIDKDYLIAVDLKNTKVKSDKTIFFYNTDLNICNIFIKLICSDEDKTIPEDLIVEFAVLKPETDEFKPLDATLISKEDLLYQVDLTTDYFDIIGTYECEIRVSGTIDNELKCFTSEEFNYVVKPNITAKLNKKISENKNLPILEKLIKDVKEITDGINKDEIQMKRDENLVGDNKTVVGAINQLREDVNSGIGGGTVELKDYQKKNDEFLNTTSKEIVGAINEVNTQCKDIAKKIDDIGTGGSGLNLRNIQNGEIFVLKTSTTKIPVTGVSLNKSTLNLNVGDTEILIPTITPDNATSSTIIWSCDNNNAKVEGGVVTALKAGTCVITATSDDTTNGTIKATCSVICSNVNVQNVSISGDTEVTTSTSITLSANITPGNATNKNVTWSKNNDNINITPNGLQCDVIGVSEGSSVITVTTEDGNKTATYNITVSTGIVAPSDCDIDSTNLQGYYRMNHLNEDNTKILDISGNGRDMTIYPNNMTIGEGYYTKVNQYQHLNNSQYSAHDSGGDQFKNVFNDNNVTLFLTVYIPSSVGGAEALFGLEAVDGFGGCTFQGGVIIYNQDQQTFNQVQSSTKSCLGSLCTLAFKHDAVNNKDYIYKDGVLLNEQDSKVDLVNGKVAEYLGIGRGYTTSYGNIKFYNWAIYNAVLNNDKIQEISTTLLTNAGGGN